MSREDRLLGRVFPLVSAACALALSLVLGLNGMVGKAAEDRILDAAQEPHAECIVILGCGIRPDGAPGKLLTQRLETGLSLYRAGCAPRILISGNGRGEGATELTAMYGWLMEQGVPEPAVLADPDGMSTCDSMEHLRTIFGLRSAVVVTQQYHLARALYLADCAGIEAFGVAAGEVPGTGYAWRLGREILARDKDFVLGQLMRLNGVPEGTIVITAG